MDIKQIAKETAKTLSSYLTYQALKTVIAQLSETNPPLAYWLSNFSSHSKVQDGEAYLEELLKEKQDLAVRIMVVRQHLAEEVLDYLPEMARSHIQKANMELQRQHLERITQLSLTDPTSHPENLPDSPAEPG